MRYALDPRNNELVTPEQLRLTYGAPIAGQVRDQRRIFGICPYCRNELNIRAAGNALRHEHFFHPQGTNCPSVLPARGPFNGLTPVEYDPDIETINFDLFYNERNRHWNCVSSLVPFLQINEFIDLVRRAKDNRSWAWQNMPTWSIPYMLLLQCDYKPFAGKKASRELYFRFWFSRENNELNELWINGEQNEVTLFRASYELPRGVRRPHEEHMTRAPKFFNVDSTLYDEMNDDLHEYVSSRLTTELLAHRP